MAELQARDVAVSRGNWLFFNTRNGADIGAMYYSLVQTAKANGLDSRKYLKLVLSSAPYMHTSAQVEGIAIANAAGKYKGRKPIEKNS